MGRKPITGQPLSKPEINRRYREARKADVLGLQARIAALEAALARILAVPRLPREAREIVIQALEGKE